MTNSCNIILTQIHDILAIWQSSVSELTNISLKTLEQAKNFKEV